MKIFIYPLLNNAGSPVHKLTHTMKTLINFKKREGENNFELFCYNYEYFNLYYQKKKMKFFKLSFLALVAFF